VGIRQNVLRAKDTELWTREEKKTGREKKKITKIRRGKERVRERIMTDHNGIHPWGSDKRRHLTTHFLRESAFYFILSILRTSLSLSL